MTHIITHIVVQMGMIQVHDWSEKFIRWNSYFIPLQIHNKQWLKIDKQIIVTFMCT